MRDADLEALEALYDDAFESGWRAAARWLLAKKAQLDHTAQGLRAMGPVHAKHAAEVEARALELGILAHDLEAAARRPKGSSPG
jgi:hypothetical protein